MGMQANGHHDGTPGDSSDVGYTESQSAYWRAHHHEQPCYRADAPYDDYAYAYRAGIEGQAEHGGRFEDAEPRLRSHYEARPGSQGLGWDQGAALACKAAWQLAEQWHAGGR